jgi:hypothetical protein
MLPERINVMKAVSYDVTEIISDIRKGYKDDSYAPTIDEVLDWIAEWVIDDFGKQGYNGLIFLDENGEELNV